MTVLEFIDNNFPLSVLENKEDEESRLGLPFPYTVPSPGDIFDCMFYWDTHFTNVGLIPSGRMQQAIYNTDNIRHMIQRFGYMPNGTKRHFLKKSQPPVYYRMVKDIFAVTKDTAWLDSHYDTIAKEYDYWMTQRLAPNGLNYYGNMKIAVSEEADALYAYWKTRIPGLDTVSKIQAVHAGNTLGESGWDCCYRFELQGPYYNPVDLNTLLYCLETAMAEFSGILGRGEETLWQGRAASRKEKMDAFCEKMNLYNLDARAVYMSPKEAAEHLGMTLDFLYQLASRANALYRINGRFFINVELLNNYFAGYKVNYGYDFKEIYEALGFKEDEEDV